MVLEGTAYERGLRHGELFASEIRSIYTQMLAASILPYLNRERPDIAAVLSEYRAARYDDGRFSYELMLDSALEMERSIPEEYVQEMEGIADGAGLPFEDVLVLNTFLDTMLALRSITFFIRGMESPYVVSVEIDGGLGTDLIDNDGDGEVDEPDEGRLDPYGPSPTASLVEVPTDAVVRFLLVDQGGAAQVLGLDSAALPEGVDPETVRVQVDTTVLEPGDPQVRSRLVETSAGEALEVSIEPTGGFEPASVVSVLLQAGDRSWVTDPPPPHARFMRDERLVFTTVGYGAEPGEVPNRGERDGRTQPPSVAFAARGSATATGEPLLAHHFAMLDANTSHKHTVLFVHRLEDGTDHAVLGWTGLVWGFGGMSANGLAIAVNSSDTLDNGMVVDVLAHLGNLSAARLVVPGMPVGIMAREVLARATTVSEAEALVAPFVRTYGWNLLLADRDGGMVVLEMDSDILGRPDGGLHALSAASGDAPGRIASVGGDDLRATCHFVSNVEDMNLAFIRPQRYWSSFYFRSLRAHSILGEHIEASLGELDVPTAIAIMRDPDLVDVRDSMSAVVFEPASARLHVAMGEVPATDGEFRAFELSALLGDGAP